LLEHGLQQLIVRIQIVLLLIVYAASWVALARHRPVLPWMAFALFVFSLTTLYPVHYLYYDVLLLLICDAFTFAIDAAAPRILAPWALSLAALAALLAVTTRIVASPFPSVVPGRASGGGELRTGFSAAEHDASGTFAWIVGHEARVVLPRSSAASADIILTAESPFGSAETPQRMVAILNGTTLGETTIPAGPQGFRIAAPRSTWWIGFNELRLQFSSTVVPREANAGEDSRALALSVRRIAVASSKK
jgi:hypothetical protein